MVRASRSGNKCVPHIGDTPQSSGEVLTLTSQRSKHVASAFLGDCVWLVQHPDCGGVSVNFSRWPLASLRVWALQEGIAMVLLSLCKAGVAMQALK